MFSMQAFHNKLFSDTEGQVPYQQGLARLTSASLAQIEAVKSLLVWETW